MSFLGGLLGKGAGSFVDDAVDKGAALAKQKLKEVIGGESEKDSSGGMGDLFPSAGKEDEEKEKGGIFGFLKATPDEEETPSGGSGGAEEDGSLDLTDALGSFGK